MTEEENEKGKKVMRKKMVVAVMMMDPHPVLPPWGTLPIAPPIDSVATATAGLRDDVECI